MIGSIYTESARDAWTCVPGRNVAITNNENGDPVKEVYSYQGAVCFAKYYTYDSDGNIINIECKAQ